MAKSRRTPWPLLTAFLIGSGALFCGCGREEKTGTIVNSPEAISADQAAQKGMMEYMQGKTAKKKK